MVRWKSIWFFPDYKAYSSYGHPWDENSVAAIIQRTKVRLLSLTFFWWELSGSLHWATWNLEIKLIWKLILTVHSSSRRYKAKKQGQVITKLIPVDTGSTGEKKPVTRRQFCCLHFSCPNLVSFGFSLCIFWLRIVPASADHTNSGNNFQSLGSLLPRHFPASVHVGY